MREIRTTLPVIGPAIALVVLSIALRVTDFDRYVSGLFYGGNGQWPLDEAQPFLFIYQYGTYPGWALAYLGMAVWLVGCFVHHGVARRAFFCMMVVVLGPGLIVNGILKPHVARPRPCQIVDFGGLETFRPLLSFGPAQSENCRSFPSGHASMGFALLAPAMLLRRRRGWYTLGLGLAISSGLVIGVTRIVQGRHFPSDVLWSAAIVYFTAVVLYYAIGLQREASLAAKHRLRDIDVRRGSVSPKSEIKASKPSHAAA